MMFDHVHIHGVTLSLLLHSAATSQQVCDGLLFGQVRKKVRSEFQDDDSGMLTIEESHAYITSFICSSSLCSFYDAVGNVSDPQLLSLEGQGDRDPLLGWFVVRPSQTHPAQPSMREQAVTSSLHRVLDQRRGEGTPSQPALLALLTQKEDHNGATISIQYRAFQHVSPMNPSSAPFMQPTELHTLSLSRNLGVGGTAPATHLVGDAIMTERACSVCGVTHPVQQQKQQHTGSTSLYGDSAANMMLASTAAASVQQVLQLEEYHQGQLRTMQALCRMVTEQAGRLKTLQLEGERLAQQLLETGGPVAQEA